MTHPPQIDPTLLTEEIDGELMILSPHSGRVLVLSQTGTRIWQLLAAGHPPDTIARHLTHAYDVTLPQARRDVADFLAQLQARGVLS